MTLEDCGDDGGGGVGVEDEGTKMLYGIGHGNGKNLHRNNGDKIENK